MYFKVQKVAGQFYSGESLAECIRIQLVHGPPLGTSMQHSSFNEH